MDVGKTGLQETNHHATGCATATLGGGYSAAGIASGCPGFCADACARVGAPLATPVGRAAGGIGGRDCQGRGHGRDAGAPGDAANTPGPGCHRTAGGLVLRCAGAGDAPPLAQQLGRAI
ncbi:hypothetical protein [Nitrosomonas communis]|uniref:hypothetical protein n=1 Tax=Nitrosomonas communis TaxID=44574 RepID=UPI0015A5344A|nr:hypothetical protein [Nitrosomonas communis]